MSDSWKKETSGYIPKIENAIQLNSNLQATLEENWLSNYFPGPKVSEASNIALRICAYVNCLFSVSYQSFPEMRSLWCSGQFVLIPLVVRYIYECRGAIHYSRKTLERLISEGNIEREKSRVNRLNFGTRSKVKLPGGGDVTEKSINVMTFIQSLSDIENSEEIYGFLSEACHPNMTQSTYFQLAGPPLSNWGNDTFKDCGHELLGKTVTIIENTCSGIQTDVNDILISARTYVENKG